MSIAIALPADRPNNPFEIARRKLLVDIAALPVPTIDVVPDAEQFGAAGDHLRSMADVFDHWLKDVGEEVCINSLAKHDRTSFNGVFAAAIDGFATFEIELAGEAAEEALQEMAS